MAKKRKATKAKHKYAVNVMLTLDGAAPVKSIKTAVHDKLENMRVAPDARSNWFAPHVTKVTIRSVDED